MSEVAEKGSMDTKANGIDHGRDSVDINMATNGLSRNGASPRYRRNSSQLTSGIVLGDHKFYHDGKLDSKDRKYDHLSASGPSNGRQPSPSGSLMENLNGIEDKLKSDIKKFVDSIFTDSQSISLQKKAEFGLLVRSPEARLLFAIFVDDHRVQCKKVSELTFYSLAQYFSIVLFECLAAEDFRPAKIIMNMMFTYYHEPNGESLPFPEPSRYRPKTKSQINSCPSQNDSRIYLYNLLKDQEIFKSIRFWTSAFYESVINERNNHTIFVARDYNGKASNEQRLEELDCSKNITFGLLGSFIHNMSLLDLSHEFCEEFLEKHSTIADLSEDQLNMLRSTMKATFSQSATPSTVSGSKSDRLTTFLHKLGTKLN